MENTKLSDDANKKIDDILKGQIDQGKHIATLTANQENSTSTMNEMKNILSKVVETNINFNNYKEYNDKKVNENEKNIKENKVSSDKEFKTLNTKVTKILAYSACAFLAFGVIVTLYRTFFM